MEKTSFAHKRDRNKSLPHKAANRLLSKLLRALVGYSEIAAAEEVLDLADQVNEIQELVDVVARHLKLQTDKVKRELPEQFPK